MRHGADVLTYGAYGELIDFSSNINPLGAPKGVVEYIRDNLNSLERYPDIKYRKLRADIAEYSGVKPENVVVGNGSLNVMDAAIASHDRIVVVNPCFGEYAQRATVRGKQIFELQYDEDFHICENAFDDVCEAGTLVILGNPNNPTGLRLQCEELERIYRKISDRGAYLMLDEAFCEYADDYDSIKLLGLRDNLYIVRACTKFFALPGLRLGYGIMSEENAKRISAYIEPWSVNSLAEGVGSAVFGDVEYIEGSRKNNMENRSYLYGEMSKLKFFHPYRSDANYILVKLLKADEQTAFDYLLKRGILVRKCGSYSGLNGEFLRFAVKGKDDNELLIDALKELDKLYESFND